MVSVSDRNKDLPFGGKVVVLGGDFRQVLPVIPKVVNDKLFVDIPSDLIIPVLKNPVEDIDRAILALTIDNVEEINNYIVDLLPGEEKIISVLIRHVIMCSGLPNHSLKLKIGVPIILLRNIDPAGGLCNGTRLVVRDLRTNVIGADIVSGAVIPFKFQRRQFPVSLSFAMTINKSQGQTLSTIDLFLRCPVFCHGQLYVALSRIRNRNGLKILLCDEGLVDPTRTENIVFKEVFDKI
nr:ATP-dependent DNA helicase PIF1-like [Arachis hypogaea]